LDLREIMKSIRSVLIANRSETAIRVMRPAAEMNIRTVAIYAEEDKLALHRFAPATPADSVRVAARDILREFPKCVSEMANSFGEFDSPEWLPTRSGPHAMPLAGFRATVDMLSRFRRLPSAVFLTRLHPHHESRRG